MADEQPKDDGEQTGGDAAHDTPTTKGEEATAGGAKADAPMPPAEALAKGLGLLFQAALGTASAVKESVERGGVHRNISDAGRHLESAATAALRGLEQLVRNVGRPGGDTTQAAAPTAPAPADPPAAAAPAPADPSAPAGSADDEQAKPSE